MRKPIKNIAAHLDLFLRDLIPGYLRNREKGIKTIIQSIKTNGFDKIRMLANSMPGSGGSYSFMSTSKLHEAS
jgi:hypothetical protein